MHLILMAATGLAGSAVLDAMLKSPEITKVSIIRRKPISMAGNNPKVTTIIHKDYKKYNPELLEQLEGAKGGVCAFGICLLKVSHESVYTNSTPHARNMLS